MDNYIMRNLASSYNIDKNDLTSYNDLFGFVKADLTKTLTGGFSSEMETTETKRYVTTDGKTEINFLLYQLRHSSDFRILSSYFVIDGECFTISNVRKEGETISFDFKYYDQRSYQLLKEKIGGTDYISDEDFERNRILPTDKERLKYLESENSTGRNIINDLQNFVYQRKAVAPSSRAC